jgi:hypothetical protein
MIENSIAGGAELDAVLALVGMSDENVQKIKKGEVDISMLPPLDDTIRVLTRFITATPEMLEETFLIALSVAPEDKFDMRPHLRQISDETGFGILDAFVEQNAHTLVDFFGRWRELVTNLVQKVRSTTSTPDSSPISSV